MSLVFPPGAQCFKNTSFNFVVTAEDASAVCPTTADMIAFLNLTGADAFRKSYFPSYCINPPIDDGCPYGYCPNPDIAGPLVRISAYLTNILVAILIFHAPESLRESFWSQVLTVWSLMITCVVSIIQHQLSRIHAIIATATAGSPLSLYIAVYAIRSMWGDGHRLSRVVGAGQVMPRLIVIAALCVWISLVIYIILPSNLSHFAQVSCDIDQGSEVVKFFFFLPIVIFLVLGSVLRQWVFTLPIQLTIFAWIFAIWLRRKVIWPPGQKYTFRFWKVWRVISDDYPFIQFSSVVMIPFVYWAATIELAVLACNDNYFSASFGQVLAMFVAVPPMIACVRLVPRFGRWFVDLTWVRFLTCRPRPRENVSSGPGEDLPMTGIYAKFDHHSNEEDDDRGVYKKVTPLTYDG